MSITSKTRIKTKMVRFSYVHAFEPTSMNEGDKKKYSSAILIPKTDKVTIKAVNDAIHAALELGKSKHFGGSIPKKWYNPLRDGDEEKDDEVYAGHMFLNAKSNHQPVIFDSDGTIIRDKEDFYSGCYGRAVLNFYAYGSGLPSKGIAVGFESAMKKEDGEKLGGGASAAALLSEFEDDDDDLL